MTSKDFVVKNGLFVTTPALTVNSVLFTNSSQVFANTTFVANGNITANNANVTANNITSNNLIAINSGDLTTNAVVNTTSILISNSTVNATVNPITIAIANTLFSANITPISLRVGNTTFYLLANTSSIYLANSTVNTGITVPTSAQYSGGYFLHANGTWALPPSTGLTTRVYQANIATSSVNTTFTITGGYTPGNLDVYNNGVHLANTEYTATNGTTVVLSVAALVNSIIEFSGYK